MSQVYFSPSTTTFFRTDTHGVPGTEGCLMPSDVVKVSLVVFEAMVKARSQGQRVIAEFNGQPTVAEPLPPSSEELADQERLWRDRELSRTEWLVTRHRDEKDMGKVTSISLDEFSELLSYRDLLREWPNKSAFPDVSKRPQSPEWLSPKQ